MHLAAVAGRSVYQARSGPVVAIVDDDPSARASTGALLEGEGYRVVRFASGDQFLEACLPEHLVCVLLDIRMPGRSGLDVLRLLSERTVRPPTLMLSGHADLELAVEAMKLGAVDFLRKPCPPRQLLRAVAHLAAVVERSRDQNEVDREMHRLVEALTKRQRQVLEGIVRGLPNKLIAWELQLSVRTVECYRADLLRRLGVRSIAEAVRIALAAGLDGE
jgi:two-component system response regulator FixJ